MRAYLRAIRARSALGMVSSGNGSEEAVFRDYSLFYYQEEGQSWFDKSLKNKPQLLKGPCKLIGKAVKKSYFTGLEVLSVLNEQQGVMHVYDTVYKKSRLFIDRAFCKTPARFPGQMYLLGTVIDVGDFLFTTGAGIPIDKISPGGIEVIRTLERYTNQHELSKPLSKHTSFKCATDVMGLCLKGGALKGHTVHYI